MSLNQLSGVHTMKHILLIVILAVVFLLIGCGAAEEATTDGAQLKEGEQPLGQTEKPAEPEKPMDQALTSFVGADAAQPAETAQPAPAAQPAKLAQYEKQIEDLRTENTGLKQKIVKLELENRGINARMTEVEAKFNAEKVRADRAEEIAKNSPPKTVLPLPEPVGTSAVVRTQSAPVSLGAYDDALKAFNGRKYDEAVKGFKSIVDGGGTDDVSIRAKYWLGESYFAKKQYKEALPLFQETLKSKNADKKADAEFMVAQTYERLGNKAKAKDAYEKVVKDYPMSKNVKRAKERWAKL